MKPEDIGYTYQQVFEILGTGHKVWGKIQNLRNIIFYDSPPNLC